MKKSIALLYMFFFLLSSVAMAHDNGIDQQKEERKNRMMEFIEQKRNYLEREVGMTQAEMKSFFPLYNELQQKKFALHRDIRMKTRKLEEKGAQITDAEYLEAVKAVNDMDVKEAQLTKEYYDKFSKILSPQKLYKLQKAENGFAKEMMRRGPRNSENKSGSHLNK